MCVGEIPSLVRSIPMLVSGFFVVVGYYPQSLPLSWSPNDWRKTPSVILPVLGPSICFFRHVFQAQTQVPNTKAPSTKATRRSPPVHPLSRGDRCCGLRRCELRSSPVDWWLVWGFIHIDTIQSIGDDDNLMGKSQKNSYSEIPRGILNTAHVWTLRPGIFHRENQMFQSLDWFKGRFSGLSHGKP